MRRTVLRSHRQSAFPYPRWPISVPYRDYSGRNWGCNSPATQFRRSNETQRRFVRLVSAGIHTPPDAVLRFSLTDTVDRGEGILTDGGRTKNDTRASRILKKGEIVRCDDPLGTTYGVVTIGGHDARIYVPVHGNDFRRLSFPDGAVRRLDNFDCIVGVDVEGETHLWSECRGVASRRKDGEVVNEHDNVSADDIGRYVRWVQQGRGWERETLNSRFAHILGGEGQ